MNSEWLVKWIRIGIVTAFFVMIIATAFADPGHTHVISNAPPCSCPGFWSQLGAGIGHWLFWPSFY